MDYLTIIGIDVSKLTLDLHALPNHLDFQTENDGKGFKKFVKWLEKDCGVNAPDSLFAFECTGHYSFKLALWMRRDDGFILVT
jgi:transposase